MAEYTGTDDILFKGKEDINILYADKRESAQSLDGKWKFDFFESFPESVPGFESLQYEASLPSSVYMNVYEAGILPHPYADTNSKLYKDLDRKIWYFARKFYVEESEKGKKAVLCAEGISYYCKIWLNGQPLVYHEGMFGGPYAELNDFLKYGAENEITIQVLAADYGKKDTFSFWNNEGTNREIVPWNLMHDSATSNGDFTVLGIWNGIRIEYLNRYHLARPYMTTVRIDEDGKSAAVRLEAEICDGSAPELNHFYGKKEGTFSLCPGAGLHTVFRDDFVSVRTVITERKSGKKVFDSAENVRLVDFGKSFEYNEYPENQFYEREITVENPLIWDAQRAGKADIYDVLLELYHEDTLCDSLKLPLGIRTVTSKRSVGRKYRTAWQNWQFVLNGKNIFVKGMNWMPHDFLYDISPEKYRTYLEMIKNQGVNMVRVWSGGGMPETDAFYDICDELGMMVWQDHFPANTISTKGWPAEVLEAQEALNIYRIRKHPSLVLHCGGNEINPYTEGNAFSLFTVSRFVTLLDPDRIFHQAALDMGSAHIYSDMEPVWYGKIFKDLPFLGESGIHSFPSYETLCECISGEILTEKLDLSKPENLGTDPGLLNHFTEFIPERVPRMLSRTSQITNLTDTTLKRISEASQTAAYEFYLLMLQSMRANYPVTTGAMPWVFKRPWPTVGVQVVDGFGRPLYQYYAVQKAFKKEAVILKADNFTLFPGENFEFDVFLPENTWEDIPKDAVIRAVIYSPQLEKVYEISENYKKGAILHGKFKTDERFTDKYFFAEASVISEGAKIAESTYWPKTISKLEDERFRDEFRRGPHPNMYFENGPWLFEQLENGPKASLKTDITVKSETVEAVIANVSDVPSVMTNVVCADKESVYVFDENFFTLEPGEKRKVNGRAVKKGCKQETEYFKTAAFNV